MWNESPTSCKKLTGKLKKMYWKKYVDGVSNKTKNAAGTEPVILVAIVRDTPPTIKLHAHTIIRIQQYP